MYKGLSDNIVYAKSDTVLNDTINDYLVRVDKDRNILPWYSSNLGESYSDAILRVWNFWNHMEVDSNGLKYYMNHQVWKPGHDPRGLGGDQIQMALSSWDLLYDFTGDESIVENMKYMADYYLEHSLSPSGCAWSDMPYPYNTDIHSGEYDGDMILGKGYLQPDKAGSLGFELIKLYKRTLDEKYLDAAIKIANTLAEKVRPGDSAHSPWPFRVNALTGEVGVQIDQKRWYKEGFSDRIKKNADHEIRTSYTSNWTGTLEMFSQLFDLDKGDVRAYQKAFSLALNWMKNYPAKTNKWGPFFEDVSDWSDTQVNAITYAMYLMEHPDLDPGWQQTVRIIFAWAHKEFNVYVYQKYGVVCTGEQTIFVAQGNSHSSREASMELMYWEKTGDTAFIRNAVRELSWATYMVDFNGENRYPVNDIWLTDGYGDYVRHYLRAMAVVPQLAPDNADHILQSSSIVQKISYTQVEIRYKTFDIISTEKFRLTSRPRKVQVNDKKIREDGGESVEGWMWQPLKTGGILTIKHIKGQEVQILK